MQVWQRGTSGFTTVFLLFVSLTLLIDSRAFAYYIGPSYVELPGVDGGAVHGKYRGWIRAEAHYWLKRPVMREIRGISGKESGLRFTGSSAPTKGPAMLSLAIGKQSPAMARLLEICRSGTKLPQLTFAESAEMARHPQEHGPRPSNIPDYYEYALEGVTLTCPQVADAPEQAFGVQFDNIKWLNAAYLPKPVAITSAPAKLSPAPKRGQSRTFVISWFAPVADSRADQCPQMNRKPTQDEYFALMSPTRAAEQRAALASKGGANTVLLPYRGPDEMNVTMLPGIVADPGHVMPQVDVVRGFNLDNHDGTGTFPSQTRTHKNYVSPEGLKGVDNQLFAVQGCIAGWRRDGFLPMIGNELRRAGGLSILIDVSGINDARNDDEVAVTIAYSADPMKRDGTSKIVLPDFTFRVNDDPEFSQDFVRFKGRIVNGVLTTEVLDRVYMHEGSATTWMLAAARMRLEFTPDGGMKAVLGGYRDWREYLAMAFFRASDYENTIGFNSPGMYNAVRRAADGLKDVETGEYNGISAAYEMEGIPAFIPPEQHQWLQTGLMGETAR